MSAPAPLLLDNSAWARVGTSDPGSEGRELVAQRLREGRLVVCLPFLLEAGYSARTGADHRRLLERLLALPLSLIHI